MSDWVNPTSAEMVNKSRYPLTKLGDAKNTRNGHRVNTQIAKAKRALRVIEAVKPTAGRWR